MQKVALGLVELCYRMEPLSEKPVFIQTANCLSEDIDNDGLLDAGEDLNSSGRLEPTNAATVTNSAVTDRDGKVLATAVYPQSHALGIKLG